VLLFTSGALSVVLAILSLRHFGDAYTVLLPSLSLGINFTFQAISGVAAGISESYPTGRGRHSVTGIVSVLTGLVLLAWPFDSIAALDLVAGIWLVIIGITQNVKAFKTRKAASAACHRVVEISNRVATDLSD
jgi:uncharacterized membrane protein HdeD (DUF308 family)